MDAAAVVDWINARWSEGRTVRIQNHLKVFEWKPKTAAAFRRVGIEPFKTASDGDLLMAQGRSYVRIILAAHKITAA